MRITHSRTRIGGTCLSVLARPVSMILSVLLLVGGSALLVSHGGPNPGAAGLDVRSTSNRDWIPADPGPYSTGMPSMAFDSRAKQTILFPGSPDNQTWSFNNSNRTWTNLRPHSSPPASYASIVYDSMADRIILFNTVGETWSYEAGVNTWTNRNPPGGPGVRGPVTLAYDSADDRVLLFGGFNTSGLLNDTWAYDYSSNTWGRRNPAAAPPARDYASLVYDVAVGRTILFGGSNEGCCSFGDTWSYDYPNDTWSNRNPSVSPPARAGASMVYDAAAHQEVLIGGPYFVPEVNATWAYRFTANVWTKTNASNAPPLAHTPAMAYDSVAERAILFDTFSTWSLDASQNAWTDLTIHQRPQPARSGFSIAYDTNAASAVLFGGEAYPNFLSDTWIYNRAANAWRAVRPSSAPHARADALIVYDSAADRIILFGGVYLVYDPSGGLMSSTAYNDLWTYDIGANTWTPRYPATSPSVGSYWGLVYDSRSDKVLLFGGNGSNTAPVDTWAYDYAADSWTQRTAAATPPPRLSAAAAYDTAADRTIIFGGISGYSLLNDTWAYDYANNTWANRTSPVGPSPRSTPALVYDSEGAQVLLLGGGPPWTSPAYNDTWSYSYAMNRWAKLIPATNPPGGGQMVADPQTGLIIYFVGDATWWYAAPGTVPPPGPSPPPTPAPSSIPPLWMAIVVVALAVLVVGVAIWLSRVRSRPGSPPRSP